MAGKVRCGKGGLGRKGILSKNRIILSSIEVLSQKGWREFCVNDVCDYAGMTRGCIQYYFRKSSDLYFSIVQFLVDEILKEFYEAVTLRRNPENPLHSFLQAYAKLMLRPRNHLLLELKAIAEGNKKNSGNIVGEIAGNIVGEIERLEIGIQKIAEYEFREYGEDLGNSALLFNIFRWSIDGYLLNNRYAGYNVETYEIYNRIIDLIFHHENDSDE